MPDDDIGQRLERIERRQRQSAERLDQILDEARTTNGRVGRLEDTVWGPVDDQRARHDSGIMGRLVNIEQHAKAVDKVHGEAEAVTSTKRWLIGIGVSVVVALLGLIGLMVQIAGVL